MFSITTESRKPGTAASLRSRGMLPAVLYGPTEKAQPIAVSRKEFDRVWKAAGESSVVALTGLDEQKEVLIHDVDLDPVTDEPRHADFYAFEKGKTLEVDVPISFVGISPAVRDLGGILVKALHELKIETLPQNLPHEIEVDLGALVALDSKITVGDLKLPAGVTALNEPEEAVALVDVYVEEKEETPMDIADIEVEKKGKEAAEGEEGEGEASEEAAS